MRSFEVVTPCSLVGRFKLFREDSVLLAHDAEGFSTFQRDVASSSSKVKEREIKARRPVPETEPSQLKPTSIG